MASTSSEGLMAMETVDDTTLISEPVAMEAETTQLLDNSKISTKANTKYFDASQLLPEELHDLSRTPFRGCIWRRP